MTENRKPNLGEPAPPFSARTTQGVINFPDDFGGKWVILYAYIGDFLPSDMSDIQALNDAVGKFASHNAEVLALSPDSVADHLAWIFSMRNQRTDGKNIDIELISDKTREIAVKYGIRNTSNDMNYNEKTIYIIDDEGIVRSIHVLPYNTGINATEIERELLALQTAKHQYGQVPSNWTPGDDIMEHPPQTIQSANINMSEREASGGYCTDWYLCYRQDSGQRRRSPTAEPRL